MVNNGLLFMTVGAIALLCLALAARDWRLVLAAAVLAAINVMLVIAALPGAAADAAPGIPRFLRVVTFNLWHYNDRMDDVAKFLAETDADAVVLQKVGKPNGALLRQALQSRYPYSVGDWGIIILSKHPILADGRIDRPGYPPWISLMVRWIRIEVNGTPFDLAGVHLARPFYPDLQQEDVAALIAFANSRTLPLVMAGDFNLSPWTEKLGRFERSSGLKRYNIFHLTWPMQKWSVPLLPLVAIDNVFAVAICQDCRGARAAAWVRPPPDRGRSGAATGCRRIELRVVAPRSHCRDQEDRAMAMRLVFALLASLLWASPALAAAEASIEVWKSATCKCCINWVKHLEANGFAVTVNAADPSMLDRIKRQLGIGEDIAACHTAKIGPYVVEGHVPAPDIKRLVAEQPDALGLTVPGMPVGSPGMEQGAEAEPYDVLLINKDGTTAVYASH
jgi:endonuclease/exonuclease/phosphatase (EEP) superfamily protein YafD